MWYTVCVEGRDLDPRSLSAQQPVPASVTGALRMSPARTAAQCGDADCVTLDSR